MDAITGPYHVVHRGDDSPLAFGKSKGGADIAVWKQAPFKKYGGYAMEQSVFEEIRRRSVDHMLLVDYKDMAVYKIDTAVLRHPDAFIVADEGMMTGLSELGAHGGGSLTRELADVHVEPEADTDEIQRLVPHDECTEIGRLEKRGGAFSQIFTDYR